MHRHWIYEATGYMKPLLSLLFCFVMVVVHNLVLHMHVHDLGNWLIIDIIRFAVLFTKHCLFSLVTSHEGTNYNAIVCDGSVVEKF